jgi:clan AA aspartic protease
MIRGTVSDSRDVSVSVEVEDSHGGRHSIQAIVDTGFDGFLTLPPGALKELAATEVGRIHNVLADGSVIECGLYSVEIIWDGMRRSIEVDCNDAAPLLGMALLDGFVLRVDAVINGEVLIVDRRLATDMIPPI